MRLSTRAHGFVDLALGMLGGGGELIAQVVSVFGSAAPERRAHHTTHPERPHHHASLRHQLVPVRLQSGAERARSSTRIVSAIVCPPSSLTPAQPVSAITRTAEA